jgi:hypothetical protein
MKVALLADPLWLAHEATLFRHLVVGLTDENVRVVSVVPRGPLGRQLSLVGERVDYDPGPWHWMRQVRVRMLRGQLAPLEVDLINALDGSLLPAARWLAEALDVPLVVNCWSRPEVQTAERLNPDGQPIAVLTPTEGLAELVKPPASGVTTRLVRPGVMRGEAPAEAPLAAPAESLNCVLFCDGRPDPPTLALLDGLVQVRSQLPQLQLFIYTVLGDAHRLWKEAAKRQLLGQVNLVGAEPGSQRLLIRADAVLLPQRMGLVRTLLLSMMGAGRPVIARSDPLLDYLIDDRTARLLSQPTADDWAKQLTAMVENPAPLQQLGQSARHYVQQHHGAAAFVAGMARAYEDLVAEPLPFAAVDA